jgi:hypothetical protein
VTAAAGLTRIRNGRQGSQKTDRLGHGQRIALQAGVGDRIDQDGWG